MNNLTDIEHDVLKEVVSIGGGSASSSLSKMINKEVSIRVPNLWLMPIEEVSGLMGGIEQVMTILAIKMSGDASGVVLFLLTEEAATKLAGTLSPENKNLVLEEIFNIIVGSSLTSLAGFLKLSLGQSIPASATDMLRAVINEVISPMGEQTDQVLVLEVDFEVSGINAGGDLYFLFDPPSSRKILESCKQNMGKSNG